MLRSNLNTINARIFNKTAIRIDDQALREVEACYRFLEKFEQGKVIYGINTGFGPMAQYRIGDADLNSLQYNIIRSHSCGAGEALPDICVRAAMLARLQTFLNAKSGVHPDVVRILADFLNNEIYPLVPRHGSVGASGDLVQLAHIALALIGEAEVSFRGETVPAAEAMAACGITPLRLRIRDGLALTNGTAVMTGIGLVNLAQARRLLGWAVKASVMLNEIVESYDDFMAGALNEYKLHAGQIEIARQMRAMQRRGDIVAHVDVPRAGDDLHGLSLTDVDLADPHVVGVRVAHHLHDAARDNILNVLVQVRERFHFGAGEGHCLGKVVVGPGRAIYEFIEPFSA